VGIEEVKNAGSILVLNFETLKKKCLKVLFDGHCFSFTANMIMFVMLCELKTHKFYVHGSVHRESNLRAVQQDSTYSVCYISVGSSASFVC